MTDYARDSQGRPVSEDGRWVWNGTDWEARQAEQATPAAATVEPDPQAAFVEPAVSSTSATPALGAEVRGANHATAPPTSRRSSAPNPRFARTATSTASVSTDDMTPARLAATTAGVVLSLGGALMLAVTIAGILIMSAFENAMSGGSLPTSDPTTVVYTAYAIGFTVATLAAFSVLYAARVPKAILGAAGIVVVSWVTLYVIGQTGMEIESLSGVLVLPLVPAAATAGFIKWATP